MNSVDSNPFFVQGLISIILDIRDPTDVASLHTLLSQLLTLSDICIERFCAEKIALPEEFHAQNMQSVIREVLYLYFSVAIALEY